MTRLTTTDFIKPQASKIELTQSIKNMFPWVTYHIFSKEHDLIELNGKHSCPYCHKPTPFRIMVPLVSTTSLTPVNILQQIKTYLDKNPDLLPHNIATVQNR